MVVVWCSAKCAPTCTGHGCVIDFVIPDDVVDAIVQQRKLGEEIAIYPIARIVGQVERVAVVVITLAFLMARIAHDPIKGAVAAWA